PGTESSANQVSTRLDADTHRVTNGCGSRQICPEVVSLNCVPSTLQNQTCPEKVVKNQSLHCTAAGENQAVSCRCTVSTDFHQGRAGVTRLSCGVNCDGAGAARQRTPEDCKRRVSGDIEGDGVRSRVEIRVNDRLGERSRTGSFGVGYLYRAEIPG